MFSSLANSRTPTYSMPNSLYNSSAFATIFSFVGTFVFDIVKNITNHETIGNYLEQRCSTTLPETESGGRGFRVQHGCLNIQVFALVHSHKQCLCRISKNNTFFFKLPEDGQV